MPTTIPTTTSSTRPGSPSAGDAYFETDTKNYIIYDGTNWRGYASDGRAIFVGTFDGTDDRVELGTLSTLNSTSAFSLTMWVKSSTTDSSTRTLWSSGSDTFYNALWFYRDGAGGTFDITLGKGGSSYAGIRYTISSQGEIFNGSWRHLGVVYNGSSIVLYLDGSTATTTTIGTAVPTSTVSTTGNNAHIASRNDDSRYLIGSLDDVAIFNTALSASQVSDIYSSDIYHASVQHRYTFDTNFNDSVGSNNGTGQGDATAGVVSLR
jgi:hypothetical protein